MEIERVTLKTPNKGDAVWALLFFHEDAMTTDGQNWLCGSAVASLADNALAFFSFPSSLFSC